MLFGMKNMNLNERARQTVWSGLAATILIMFGAANMLDQHIWLVQSALDSRPVSRDIVFATSRHSLADPEFPARRELLAKRIEQMQAAGAKHIYFDIAFDRHSSPKADRALANAIDRLKNHGTIAHQSIRTIAGDRELDRSLPEFSGQLQQAISIRKVEYLGYGWKMPFGAGNDGKEVPSLASALAGRSGPAGQEFPIYYGFDLSSVPVIYLDDANLGSADFERLRGKQVVIGAEASSDSESAKIPGQLKVPASIVSIYAAETLKAGLTNSVETHTLVGIYLVLLLLIGLAPLKRRYRHSAYIALVASLVLLIATSFIYGLRLNPGGVFITLLWFAGLRARANWQKKFALEDDKTGLPTFRALEKHFAEEGRYPALVIAKIHGADDVAKALSAERYKQYIRSLVERFKVTQRDLKIFVSEGRYFAFFASESDVSALESHLEGLRALFAAPVFVDGQEIDAGITFGVDMSVDMVGPQRIASALAVVEQSSEAHRPIVFAETANEHDALWKISLQSRIDTALEKNEIYLVYQPKVEIDTGRMVGVEALVRWDDPSRGTISPAYFIQECERAGRMDHLTRHVLEEAAQAAVNLRDAGIDCKMSVNISATLFRDDRVAQMVKKAIGQTGIEPRRLILEVTETSRIEDTKKAAQILRNLREIGVGISIDDFGIGAANLETLVNLPFDELKIDRLFVANVDRPKPKAIIRMLTQFARELRISLVAEGVEDQETLEKLKDLGCELVQGYHISRPLKFNDLMQFQYVMDMESLTRIV